MIFVTVSLVEFGFFSVASQEIGWGGRLRNDIVCVEWDVKPCSIHPKIRKMPILDVFAGAGFGGDAQYYGTSGPTSTNGYLDTGGGGQYAQHDSSYNPGQYCEGCHSYVCHACKFGLL